MHFRLPAFLATLTVVPVRLRQFAAALAVGAVAAMSVSGAGATTDAKAALRCVGPLDVAGIDRILADGGSPLAGQGQTFVVAAASVGIDPRALIAIGAHESVLLTYGPAARIHNPFGIGPNRVFTDDGAAISFAAKLLAQNYLSEGRLTLGQISSKWAPLGVANDPTNLNANWTGGVGELYRRLGGNPDAPITLAAQFVNGCGAATPVTETALATTAPEPTHPLVPAGAPAPGAIAWSGRRPTPVGPGMAGGRDPRTDEPATREDFVFPLLAGASKVAVRDTFAAPALPGAPGCYHVAARCNVQVSAPAGLPVVAAAPGVLVAATPIEQRAGVAFWILTDDGDRIGYSGLATYTPGIAARTAVSAGQLLGTTTPHLTIAWERRGRPINAAPLLRATLAGA